ncbi:MAG: aminopeptidase [Spirochaetaceae bacterium]|jgi:aspartyl aminopeptidase|nr:aminopeptidase [Spirochaetaceae bacterium]
MPATTTIEEKTEGQKLGERLGFKIKNTWETATEADMAVVEAFAGRYKAFLNAGKTERELTAQTIERLREAGFVDIEDALRSKDVLGPGAKVYQNIHGKALNFAVLGKRPLAEGTAIVGAHLDSPRIDLKTNPVYEDAEFALFDTHYYGGIKKWQWPTVPLALHGVIFGKDGVKKTIRVGEDEDDPVFVITDLLPHLSHDYDDKKMTEYITGEELDILAGSRPFKDEKAENKVKLNLLNILNEQYGVTEADFASAEIEAVPAQKARDVGFDRSMIGAYGHDDKCCAFASIEAVLAIAERAESNVPDKTVVCVLTDKEEIGSMGNTGAEARNFEDFIAFLLAKSANTSVGGNGSYCGDIDLRRALTHSAMLSSDVNAAFDPNFASVFDKKTCSYLGKGLAISKYTGSRGKYGGSDANAEFLHRVLGILDKNGVRWQFGNLGKVDKGGGGTIALHFARLGVEVLDCGIPVLSMHSPFEVISKIDLWTAYQGYLAFLQDV